MSPPAAPALGLHYPLPRARARARPAPEEIPETCEIIRKIKLWIRDTKQSKQQRKQDEQHYTRDKLNRIDTSYLLVYKCYIAQSRALRHAYWHRQRGPLCVSDFERSTDYLFQAAGPADAKLVGHDRATAGVVERSRQNWHELPVQRRLGQIHEHPGLDRHVGRQMRSDKLSHAVCRADTVRLVVKLLKRWERQGPVCSQWRDPRLVHCRFPHQFGPTFTRHGHHPLVLELGQHIIVPVGERCHASSITLPEQCEYNVRFA
eukprot:scaffold50486_cov76-Phaeocystis_antarctica.AAC.7